MRRVTGALLGLLFVLLAASACWRSASQNLPPSAAPAGTTTPVPSDEPPAPTAIPPTATSTPTPTPTPSPAELLSDAERALTEGDYRTAVESYDALLHRSPHEDLRAHALLNLGRAHARDQSYPQAIDAFQTLLTDHPGAEGAHAATFMLADALAGAGKPLSATTAYSSYLRSGTVITPYLNAALGDAFRSAGVYTAAVAAYEQAIVDSPARVFEAQTREKLALAHVARGAYAAAVDQYDAILRFAQNEQYRAEIDHQAAETWLLAGDFEAGYERHTHVVESYPTRETAYRSLVKLVEAGRPVDDFLRGKVDYYGGAYGPAVQALYRYIRAFPETHSGDAHWYAGLSFLEADSIDLAINEFELLIDTHPESQRRGDAWLKLAEVLGDRGQVDQAVATYRAFLDEAPDHPLGATALWEAAQLLERTGTSDGAGATYLECQSTYPDADIAARALFRGGLQRYRLGEYDEAAEAWIRLADRYEDSPYGPAALLWCGKAYLALGESDAAEECLLAAATAEPDQYYGLRAAQLTPVSDTLRAPSPGPDPQLRGDEDDDAASWLTGWLELETSEGLDDLSPRLTADGRLQRGRELWELDRFQQARTELEALRSETYSNALDQYQLALAYRDLGIYRSSILCAQRVINLSPLTDTLKAPSSLLRLAYPTFYESLVLENAARTGLDPLLVFSLIRQESLFESLATSTASAQGLMQVIPPTGAEIASDLGWPEDYTTADLYLPYVSLRFGTHYLAKQRDRFGGRIDAALAAYNGGPSNAQRWLARTEDDVDLFLEQITFSETRLYLKRIQENLAVYRALYPGYAQARR